MGDDQHHAEQQRDGAEIDRFVRVVQRQGTCRDHERRAEKRRAGAVQPQERQPAERDDQVGGEED